LHRDPGPLWNNFNHGWTAEATFNFNKWIGMTANFSGTYDSQTFPPIGTFTDHVYPLLFGPTLKYRTRHFEPYVHALFGFEHIVYGNPATFNPATSSSDTQFALALGGGVDAPVSKHFALRIGNFDYYKIKKPFPFHSFRFSTGLQFRF